MQRGSAAIQDTPLGCLLVGMSWMKLFFRADDTNASHPVLKPGERLESYICRRCNVVVLTPLPWHA
jgi:hypothetical protein